MIRVAEGARVADARKKGRQETAEREKGVEMVKKGQGAGEKRGEGSRLQESNLTLHSNMECSSTSAPTEQANNLFI
jgi:hypothetical protein